MSRDGYIVVRRRAGIDFKSFQTIIRTVAARIGEELQDAKKKSRMLHIIRDDDGFLQMHWEGKPVLNEQELSAPLDQKIYIVQSNEFCSINDLLSSSWVAVITGFVFTKLGPKQIFDEELGKFFQPAVDQNADTDVEDERQEFGCQ